MTPFLQRSDRAETRPFRWTIRRLALFLVAGALLFGCDVFGDEETSQQDAVYPAYVDEDGNGINDYVEASGHDPGPSSTTGSSHGLSSGEMPKGPAPPGHAFVDENEDGICDYAQNGSATWHGPGFVDENGNGICDYWDEASPRHRRHEGMRFRDENGNQINDHFEQPTHQGPRHDFVDEDGDGICDRAQDGSPTWHGPNFVDEDGDGRCDYWEPGGRGHGGRHGHGGGGGR